MEAYSSGETEAGTTQSDVIRAGVVSILVSFSVSPKWLKILKAYSKKSKIAVDYFDTEDLELKQTEMYIDGYKAKPEKDTSYKGLWSVSYTLNEMQKNSYFVGIIFSKGGEVMIENFDKYFETNKDTPKYEKSDDPNAESLRYEKAKEQATTLKPISLSVVYAYINEFLEECRYRNGFKTKCSKVDSIKLDNSRCIIIDNGIIVKECKWIENIWDDKNKKYSQFDIKYSNIQRKFGLSHSKNILWFKFTTDGYLGVVAKGQDINFDYTNRPGKYVKSVLKSWDASFAFIFPLTDEILGDRKTGEIEMAVGNYLCEKVVPLIDYYSHNY